MAQLDLSDADKLPKRWRNGYIDGESNIERFVQDWEKIEEYYESLGLLTHGGITDGPEPDTYRFQPRESASLNAAAFNNISHEVDKQYLTVQRKLSEWNDEEPLPGQEIMRQMNNDAVEEIIVAVVPVEDAPALEANGWQV